MMDGVLKGLEEGRGQRREEKEVRGRKGEGATGREMRGEGHRDGR